MVDLNRYINRSMTLIYGNKIYERRVIKDFSHEECHYNSGNGNNQKRHYFETKDGKRIPISSRTVTKEKGLVLKLKR